MTTMIPILFALAVAPAPARADEKLEIVLKKQAFVERLVFAIQDVAEVQPVDHPLRQSVLEIPLGASPKPKYPRTVTTSAILFALQDHGFDLAAVRIAGAPECLVQVRPVALKGSDLLEQARAYLESKITSSDEYEIEAPEPPPDIELPATREPAAIAFEHGKAPVGPGVVRVTATVTIEGEPYTKVLLSFRLRVFSKVFVAAAFIPRGTSLSTAPIIQGRVERAAVRGEPLLSLEQLVGLVARRDLREGDPLLTDDGVRPIVVRFGDAVTIVVQRGQLTVTAKGNARGEGAVGDLIPVQNLDTKRILKGRVDGPGLISIP